MVIIVGLGNPGSAYASTKHNVGFQVVDKLAQQLQLNFETKPKLAAELARNSAVMLVKPQTFMNRSGQAVQAVLNFFNFTTEQLYVVHDDLDIPLGSYKVQHGVGPKQHRGLLSLYEYLHTEDFWHVRIGVDSRAGARIIPPDQYVLLPFSVVEQEIIAPVLTNVCTELSRRIQS